MRRIGLLLLAIVLINLCLEIPLAPQVAVKADQTLSIGVQTPPPSFEVVPIADIPAYGVIEPTGCGYFKGWVKIRFDVYMTPDAPYYDIHYVQVVDTSSPEYLAGYPGKVDEDTGEPLDLDDYNKWWDSLPRVWVNNPCHSHFVYFGTKVDDEAIKAKLVKVTEYFYAFHKYCWDNGKPFIEEWKKVPIKLGEVRDSFVEGTEDKIACEPKVDDIITRLADFDTRTFVKGGDLDVDLNIGEKGTIDVGEAAIDRDTYAASGTTRISKGNPANASGTIDTVEIWALTDLSNCEVATFEEVSADTFTSRDSETIGTVSSGSKQEFTGLDMDVETDDYIGEYHTSGLIESDETGGQGYWYLVGDQIPCTSASFTLQAWRAISLYGTGTEGGCSPNISNDPSSWNVNGGNPVSESSEYSSGLTYFTITNNSGGTVDISIGGTDMTGGGYTWTLSDTATPGDMICGLKSGLDGGDYTIVVKKNTPYNKLVENLADEGTQDWGLKLYTPTNFDDGNSKSGTITLTAVCI